MQPSAGAMLIGGEWVPRVAGAGIDVVDPGTGTGVATVADATLADARSAVDAAHDAFGAWAATAPRERSEILRRAFELMIERRDELAELIVRENGKTLADAAGEVAYAAEFFRWFAEEAPRLTGEMGRAPGGAHRIMTIHQPVGVALLVTPWNFPAAMITRKVGPALAAGCTVVVKPATETPLTALAIARVLVDAGVPAGVVNVIPTSRTAEVVADLMTDPRVRKLSFTGSTAVGRRLLAQAAPSVMNCSMELGGNAPFLVLADADLDDAVAGAMVAKMRNGGQACTSANRFIVHASVAAEFTRRLGAAMAALRVDHGLAPGAQVGPLISPGARGSVAELVERAAGAGATVATGGSAPERDGWFYRPTVLAGVAPDAEILGTEIFGPVAPVVAFESEDEAIALANATELGLASYVYTGDLRRGLRVAEAVEAGMVAINRGLLSDPAAPFGGVKQSGLGREGGHDGIMEFAECKYVSAVW